MLTSNPEVIEAPPGPEYAPIEAALADLDRGRRAIGWRSVAGRIQLAEACAERLQRVARDWVDVACREKGVAGNKSARAEEIVTGPMATMRYLRLLTRSLREVELHGHPLPPKVIIDPEGRLRVRVFPCPGLFDRLLLWEFQADAWMEPGVTTDSLWSTLRDRLGSTWPEAPISLVLGAGNNSCIPAIDSLERIIERGQVVLLKLNPVNNYLGPIYEQAFSPLIEVGGLRIIRGGADVGAAAMAHPEIDDVHLTGSLKTYKRIVWGGSDDERSRRQRDHAPILRKPLTCELGNVTPWILTPGPYSHRQLMAQADTVAAALTANAGFNCVTPRVLVTWRRWNDQPQFLDLLQHTLDSIPRRPAYYPNALENYRGATGSSAELGPDGSLPWTVLRDVDPAAMPGYFASECFTNVCVEVAIDAASEQHFLDQAVDFVNEKLWGNLAAAITIHPECRWPEPHERRLQSCLKRLKHTAIAINQSPGVIFWMMSAPWGGSAQATLSDPQSGIGKAHGTLLLDRVEKTVLEGPLVVHPNPFWLPSHPDPEPVAWRLLELYHDPSVWHLANMLTAACHHPS